jgi:hypothetical protein
VNKKLAAAITAAVIIGGGATATIAVAGAQTGTTTTTAPANATPPDHPDRGAAQKSALDPLVADGTITQEQEDKVLGALENAAPMDHHGGPGGPGGHMLGAGMDVVANALGITTDELKTDLQNGQSIADIAKAKGVDPATVVQAITDAANTKLDEAVASGKLTQDQADKIKANETEMITAMVNGTPPTGGGKGMFGGPGMFGGHGPGMDHDGPPPSTTTPTTTS